MNADEGQPSTQPPPTSTSTFNTQQASQIQAEQQNYNKEGKQPEGEERKQQ
jgi:hypothetical protein